MNRILASIIAFGFSAAAQASHEGAVDPQSVVLDYKKFGVEIAIGKDGSGNLTSLKVNYAGKSHDVPAEELEGFGKDFVIGEARVLVGFADGGSPVTQSSFERFVVSIPYGEITVNMEGEREIHSFDEVRFEFVEGRLRTRWRSISLGDDKKSWKLFFKNVGDPEQNGGAHQGASNPYRVRSD